VLRGDDRPGRSPGRGGRNNVAPLWFPVARDSPGGIETLLAGLVDEQIRQGASVTLVASGDSHTAARLEAVLPVNAVEAMASGAAAEYVYLEQEALARTLALADEFDVVHSHVGPSAFALSAVPGLHLRLLHTHHNEITPDLLSFVSRNPDLWLSTVSRGAADQLRAAGGLNLDTVANGISGDAFPVTETPGDGLAFLGRIESAKGPDIAIRVAREAGRALTLAGPIIDDQFFAERIQPLLGETVAYVGSLGHDDKCALLASSVCTIVPSRVEEGFGMVAVESMACGTPVVSSGRGALSEIVDDGITGYTCDPETMVERIRWAVRLDRLAVADHARRRFGIERTAAAYLALYERGSRAGASS
jgi:glycosyltransferase involved in cell wall biosynthesis